MLYILSSKKTNHSVYNFSSNHSISIAQLAKDITKALNHNISPITIEKPGTYTEIPYQSIDGTRFAEEFNYEFTPFKDAIQKTYKAYKESL